ncbi:uncharacterized protein LOC111705146 [Eurytemora carolleeae]|uniref:uncharacterized protein LOC111705146 n=1 Tax=Eurytemora carolleeae TaxID=1294199 RepID=UPI000C785058|nr:uncharacterized protein LOC111705146 [Eurytemora carolleeae]|eukprot:XP_023333374.1 uncharacterized protein LOC111705146 [Eurytemora affinis]
MGDQHENKLSRFLAPDKMTKELVQTWLDSGQLAQLETAVLKGKGYLINKCSTTNTEANNFIQNTLPGLKSNIEDTHELVERGDLFSLQSIPDIRLLVSRDEFGEMPVHIAARQGHMHMLSFILELCPGAARCVDSMRRTSVHYAATCKDESVREIIIELLVQAGVDPEARDLLGWSKEDYIGGEIVPIKRRGRGPNSGSSRATSRGSSIKTFARSSKELIPEILVAVNTKNFEKLVDLILNGDGKQLQDIETSNKDIQVFIRNIPGFQTKIQKIHNSVKDGSLENLKIHLDRKKFAHCLEGKQRGNILHTAVQHAQSHIAQYIIKNYPELLNRPDALGRTPLHWAALDPKSHNLYQNFKDQGGDDTIKDLSGNTASAYFEEISKQSQELETEMEDVMQEEKKEIDEPKTEEDNKNDHEEEYYEEKDITPEKNDKENETKHKKEPEFLEHKENNDYTMMLEDIENDDNDYDVESIIDDINIKKVNQENKEKVDKETEKSYIKETNLENQTELQNSEISWVSYLDPDEALRFEKGLSYALKEVSNARPDNPIEYLANQLKFFHSNF